MDYKVKKKQADSPSIFVVAGEASGDVLGASAIKALRKKGLQNIQGVGGALMEKAGHFKSCVPLSILSVMGLQMLWKLPSLLSAFFTIKKALKQIKPDILLTFDAPELSFRLAKSVPEYVKRIHCVAPSVWAWRPGRAKKIAKFLDYLCVLFPFEIPFFTPHGLKTVFVGHPKASEIKKTTRSSFWETVESDEGRAENAHEKRLLLLMPGSRTQEIKRLWPLFRKVAMQAEMLYTDLSIAVLVAPEKKHALKGPPMHWLFLEDPLMHKKAMAAATCALVASGTATLELGLMGCPMVVAYKIPRILGWCLKKFIRTPFFSLPNILLQEACVPECMQSKCSLPGLLEPTLSLLEKKNVWWYQKKRLETLMPLLTDGMPDQKIFGDRVAHVVKEAIETQKANAQKSMQNG